MKLESTPHTVLKVLSHGNSKDQSEWLLEIYWSQRSGIYGHQICYKIYYCDEMIDNGTTKEWGYCKGSYAFNKFLGHVYFGENIISDDTVNYYLHDYYKGGNYYECTKSQLLRALK